MIRSIDVDNNRIWVYTYDRSWRLGALGKFNNRDLAPRRKNTLPNTQDKG